MLVHQPGRMTESYILFGIGLSSGISLSGYFIKFFKDNHIFVGALFIILIVNGIQIAPNLKIDYYTLHFL
jgi:hypothetical protein